MRIIAGEHRGRLIQAPPGEGTRPMLDRVREALFSTLGEQLVDARVLDLFAGSGSLGLEALSRGASSARLVERDAAVVRVLRSNVAELELGDRAHIVGGDALAEASWGAGELYDIVFFDPPYPLLDDPRTSQRVFAALRLLMSGHVAPGATLMFHAPRGRLHELQFGPEIAAKLREYGTNALWYLSARATGERAT
jgi:16S rRNA (guanine966-N2)-methyltransferase